MADFLGAGICKTICFPHLADWHFQQGKLHHGCTDYSAQQKCNRVLSEVSTCINSRWCGWQRHFTQSALQSFRSTRHVCGMIVPFVENYKKSIQNKNLIEKEHAVHASTEQERCLIFYFLCCSRFYYLVKIPFSLRIFSKIHLCCSCHYIQSQNSHKICLYIQEHECLLQVHSLGRCSLAQVHYLPSRH